MKRRGFFGTVLAGLVALVSGGANAVRPGALLDPAGKPIRPVWKKDGLGWAATRFKDLKVGDIFRHGFPDEIDKKTGQPLESIEFEVARPATYLEKEGTWELFVHDVREKESLTV